MPNATKKLPPMMQMFDRYVDREYYKVTPRFFGNSETRLRSDRLENETILYISTEKMPDRVLVNNEEYLLVKL